MTASKTAAYPWTQLDDPVPIDNTLVKATGKNALRMIDKP
jgi:hypothetical protein